MRAWTLGLLMATGLAMPVSAAAKPKLPEAVAPLPDIEEMLTQAGWTITPEMSAKFSRPGDILDAKNTTLVDGADCFDAEVKEGAFARMEVTRSMAAGVRMRVKVVGVRGGVALEKKIIFDTPIYRQISRFKLVPKAQCAAFIRAAQQRGEDISGWHVITESLSAVIQQQQCGKYDASAGTFLVSADASITQACAQTSLEPVAVAYKTMPASAMLQQLPDTGPAASVQLGGEAVDYKQLAASARASGGAPSAVIVGEATVEMGEKLDYSALAAQAVAKKAERERVEAAIAAEQQRQAEEGARREAALEAERERMAEEEAALKALLQAERKRRIDAARQELLQRAESDFQPLIGLLRGPMSPDTKAVLNAYLRRYRSAKITVDDTTAPVSIPGVAQIDRALGAETAREKAVIAAARRLRIEAAKVELLANAAADFRAIKPILAGELNPEAHAVLKRFVDQYGGAKITVDTVVETVVVPGVSEVRRKITVASGAGVRGRAVLRGIDTGGSEHEDGIMSVVRRKKSQVQYCYEQSLKLNPNIGGEMEVEVNIVNGRVTSARVMQTATADSAIGSCVVSKVRRWRFPPEVTATIRLPFSLSPG